MSKANKGKSSLQPPDFLFAQCCYAVPDSVDIGENSEESWCPKDTLLDWDEFLMPYFSTTCPPLGCVYMCIREASYF